MKKVFLLLCAVVFTTLVMSFTISKGRQYGGSASVSVDVYASIYTSEGVKKGDKTDSFNLESNVRCSYSEASDAKQALKDDLERQKSNRMKSGDISEFSSSIYYDIDSCDN